MLVNMENISKNITFENWIDYKGKQVFKIENTPNDEQIANGKLIAENIFEVLVEQFGEIVKIENGFLNAELNMKIYPNLNFNYGDALKISGDIDTLINADIFKYIKNNLEFDTLVWLYGSNKRPQFIYVSYNAENNKKVLRSKFNKELNKVEFIDYEPTAI